MNGNQVLSGIEDACESVTKILGERRDQYNKKKEEMKKGFTEAKVKEDLQKHLKDLDCLVSSLLNPVLYILSFQKILT